MDLYPQMFLAPNGKVFNSGPTQTTRYLDTAGSGTWSFVANRVGPYRDYGSAVMYAPGKILVMGGGDPPTNTAEVIDLNQPSPTWRAVGSMAFARRQLNATLLPDGNVLVTGGTSSPGFNNPAGAVHAAELWDPTTEQWTTLASSSGIPRVYHSTCGGRGEKEGRRKRGGGGKEGEGRKRKETTREERGEGGGRQRTGEARKRDTEKDTQRRERKSERQERKKNGGDRRGEKRGGRREKKEEETKEENCSDAPPHCVLPDGES